jgi:hypothetical protein
VLKESKIDHSNSYRIAEINESLGGLIHIRASAACRSAPACCVLCPRFCWSWRPRTLRRGGRPLRSLVGLLREPRASRETALRSRWCLRMSFFHKHMRFGDSDQWFYKSLQGLDGSLSRLCEMTIHIRCIVLPLHIEVDYCFWWARI